MQENQTPPKKTELKRALDRGRYAFKRLFFGNKDLPFETEGAEIESPSKLLREAFFRKKTAVVALVFLVALFLFVFIAPAFVPMDVNYTDPLQQNVAPVYSMRSVPKALKNSIQTIDGFSGFTVGLSKEGEVFVWGNSRDRLNKRDMKDIPESVKAEGATHVAAGKDHILAITKSGALVGWGDRSCGQYGFESVLNAQTTPEALRGGVLPTEVKTLVCGYQTSALVKTDGTAYAWGNKNAARNLSEFAHLSGVEKLAFTNAAAVAISQHGEIFTGTEDIFTSVATENGTVYQTPNSYLSGRKAVELAATNKCVAILTEDRELFVSGVFENGENELPTLQEGEYFLSLDGGTRHFVGVTNFGNAYAWGHGAYGQCDLQTDGKTAKAFAGALQSYTVDGEDNLVQSVGLKGYIMGTDGRDGTCLRVSSTAGK